MSYAAGEAQLLTTIRLLALFNSKNSGRLDWKMLNTGASNIYAILRPGPSDEEITGLGNKMVHVTYQTFIEIWQMYQDTTDAVTLETNIETVRAHLRKYRFLGLGAGNTLGAQVVGTSDMQERWLLEGGPRWAYTHIILQWQEQAAVTLSE